MEAIQQDKWQKHIWAPHIRLIAVFAQLIVYNLQKDWKEAV